jgi:hypothetical protein
VRLDWLLARASSVASEPALDEPGEARKHWLIQSRIVVIIVVVTVDTLPSLRSVPAASDDIRENRVFQVNRVSFYHIKCQNREGRLTE